MEKLRSLKVLLSFANATDVFHNGGMPIPGGITHLWFSSAAEFGMTKPVFAGDWPYTKASSEGIVYYLALVLPFHVTAN